MTRIQTLLLTTTLVAALPLAALAQTGGTSITKCGPVTWSQDKMAYVGIPCTGGETVGAAGPTVYGTNSTTITKQEMKQGTYAPMPMQTQAVAGGPAMFGDQCGALNAVAITDEYGRKYNCRGDLIRRR